MKSKQVFGLVFLVIALGCSKPLPAKPEYQGVVPESGKQQTAAAPALAKGAAKTPIDFSRLSVGYLYIDKKARLQPGYLYAGTVYAWKGVTLKPGQTPDLDAISGGPHVYDESSTKVVEIDPSPAYLQKGTVFYAGYLDATSGVFYKLKGEEVNSEQLLEGCPRFSEGFNELRIIEIDISKYLNDNPGLWKKTQKDL